MSAKNLPAASPPPAGDVSFSDANVDRKRRRLLVNTVSAASLGGVAALAFPMLASMSPSARARAAGAPVEADISKLSPGQMMIVEWRGKPVWFVNRTDKMLESLSEVSGELADPDSEVPQQPEYAQNQTRSIKENMLVMVGICTHLGCSPTFRPDVAPADLGHDWKGGFFCPCHGSKFDLAGRVYKGVPAPTNMEVPPYFYIDDNRVRVGEDGGAAA